MKSFIYNKKVKWCPGCGNFSILKQIKSLLSEIGVKKEKIVFVSGIGCSSRLPYYLNTFGIHGIHGRAPSIATGIKLSNTNLSVWIITGDGDGLSIGGNHLIHFFRRNINVNILLFNNKIYGLTKGQYSPTSSLGKKTKYSPLGTIERPFNTLSLALGSGATFVARSIDINTKHLKKMLLESNNHIGTSFLEIYQNCNIFNNGVFSSLKKKKNKYLYLEPNKPLLFGTKCILLNNNKIKIKLYNKYINNKLWIHDIYNLNKAFFLSNFFYEKKYKSFPCPFGVIYKKNIYTYDKIFNKKNYNFKKISLDQIFSGLK
ncbi:2-oxoglutarate ferredoxin oxidoreductase beta subunit [Candidatus Karelsulcia muelleri CARI]|uniref:2-oxoglutarate ferredoxin oxidoreductase beta subunit n=1 Tax=Karelsulcia muelleri (strain CARI) TaxID=706194 RepID=E0TJB3_KARMC|nr:2-oxoglutarate ferredoxin oxidoreductase beta subunit [Candidatus Karelsulcia muelleri CARI]